MRELSTGARLSHRSRYSESAARLGQPHPRYPRSYPPRVVAMKFCYADPPYLGQGHRYDHAEASIWNDELAHVDLVQRLLSEFPDGWALSLSVPSLPVYLRSAPDARVCSWVKPFAAFKPNVGLAYTWEPVLVMGGRKRTRKEPTCRDHLSENITLKKGLVGAKPLRFNQWILGLLNWAPSDEIVDAFPGTGGMAAALALGLQDIGGPRKTR